MALLVDSTPSSTPPSFDNLYIPTSPRSLRQPKQQRIPHSLPGSRSGSFSQSVRPDLSSYIARSSLSTASSPRSSANLQLSPPRRIPASPLPASPVLSQADLHSVLFAAVTAAAAQYNTDQAFSPPSASSLVGASSGSSSTSRNFAQLRMRSLSHSQATARTNNAMLYPSVSSAFAPPPSHVHSYDDGESALLDDDLDAAATTIYHSRISSFASSSNRDKENINTPSSSRRGSSTQYHKHHYITSAISTTPASTPPMGAQASFASFAKQQRRRSSVPHPRSPSTKSSRPSSIVGESALVHQQHSSPPVSHFLSPSQRTPSSSSKRSSVSSNQHNSSGNDKNPTPSPSKSPGVISASPREDSPIKDRRASSRHSSQSSSRIRSRPTSQIVTGTSPPSISTPRSRRSPSPAGNEERNFLTLHSQSSSLSVSSDSTLQPTSPQRADRMQAGMQDTLEARLTPMSGVNSPSLSRNTSSTRLVLTCVIKIKDFAFPEDDPRFTGEPAPPTPIDLPSEDEERYGSWVSPNSLNGQMALGPNAKPSPSLSVMSSSSSSSLSSSFTPPPFGAFGYGHHYHYASQDTDALRGQRDPHGQLQLPPGGSWSTWDQSNFATENAAGPSNADPAPSGPTRSWNFVTDNGPSPFSRLSLLSTASGQVPSNLLDSALSIQNFDDDFDEDDNDEDDYNDDRSVMLDDDEAGASPSLGGAGQYDDKQNQESFSRIPPGGSIYRVQYEFCAQVPQEMDVCEGDLVRVWQQSYDGWVLGAKVRRKQPASASISPSTSTSIPYSLYRTGDPESDYEELASGLVPQSYLVLMDSFTVLPDSFTDETPEDGDQTIQSTQST